MLMHEETTVVVEKCEPRGKKIKMELVSGNDEVASKKGSKKASAAGRGKRKPDSRRATPEAVAKRNERERNRVKQVNHGFITLRQHVPSRRRMSKVQTLKAAIDYIQYLQAILDRQYPTATPMFNWNIAVTPTAITCNRQMASVYGAKHHQQVTVSSPLTPAVCTVNDKSCFKTQCAPYFISSGCMSDLSSTMGSPSSGDVDSGVGSPLDDLLASNGDLLGDDLLDFDADDFSSELLQQGLPHLLMANPTSAHLTYATAQQLIY